jgi:hypothetical protein
MAQFLPRILLIAIKREGARHSSIKLCVIDIAAFQDTAESIDKKIAVGGH